MKRPAIKRRGMTLIEILITLPIIAITGVIAVTILIRGWQYFRFGLAQTDATYETTNSLERISRVLRSTNKVVAAGSNDLTIQAYFSPRDDIPDQARYYKLGNQVFVDVIAAVGTAPNYTYPVDNKVTYKITDTLNSASEPVFRYYNEAGTELTGSVDVSAIRVVGLTLISNPKPNDLKKNQRGDTQIQLRNMKTNL